MRRGLKFEGVAVAGIGMVRFNSLREYPLMHMARDAGLLALHDAGRIGASMTSRPPPRPPVPPISVNLSKHSAMATSVRPDATAHAASRNATRPVADAFSMCVTGSPVRPSSFMAFTPIMEPGVM